MNGQPRNNAGTFGTILNEATPKSIKIEDTCSKLTISLVPCRGVKAANDIARKERLQRGVVKLDDEGEHLCGDTTFLRGEVDADNVGDRLGRIGACARFAGNITHCTRLGGIDCLCHLARTCGDNHRGYGDGGGMTSNCIENW